MRVAVLIPCYNEALTVGKVVADFRRALPQADIWVFDNASTDDTARLAAEAGANVRRVAAKGKGNVVRAMFRDVDADIVLMDDNLIRLDDALMLSRRTLGIATQSILVGLGLSCAGMVAASFGMLTPVAGALFQEAVDLAVIANALRAAGRFNA